MFRTLDRYIVREVIPPAAIALAVFTLALELNPLGNIAEPLIARGADWTDIVRLMVALVPQSLGLTIPMSLLVGVLVAAARLSADREYVAAQACGISLYRLLRPVTALGVAGWAVSSYVMLVAAPAAVSNVRALGWRMLTTYVEDDIRPRVFLTGFRGRTIYIRDLSATGWTDVFVSDETDGRRPAVYIASRGHLSIDREKRLVNLVLENGTRHIMPADRPDKYELLDFRRVTVALDWATVFPTEPLQKTEYELSVGDLRRRAADLPDGGSESAELLMIAHERFAFPLACPLLAILGLALGASTGRSGRLGSFLYALAIIFVYYVILFVGRSLATAGRIAAWQAIWTPNLLLAATTGVLVAFRSEGHGHPAAASAGIVDRLRASAAIAVEAASRFRGPRLGTRTLDRYVARIYFKMFWLALVGVAGVFYISTLTDLAPHLFRMPGAARLAISYLLFDTPQIAYFAIPLSVLVSVLVTIGILTSNSEIVVMKACGVGLARIVAPLLMLSAVWSAVLFGMQEYLMAPCNRRAIEIRRQIDGSQPEWYDVLDRTWMVGRTGAIYHYADLDRSWHTLRGVSVFQFSSREWRLRQRLVAASMVQVQTRETAAASWIASDGRTWTFDGQATPAATTAAFATRALELEPMEYLGSMNPEPEQMTFGELGRSIAELPAGGHDASRYVVALNRRFSFPLVTIIMTLMAVPFGLTIGRSGALHGVAAGICLGFGYWLASSVFAAMGSGNAFSPALAAWLPDILFGASAVCLLRITRT